MAFGLKKKGSIEYVPYRNSAAFPCILSLFQLRRTKNPTSIAGLILCVANVDGQDYAIIKLK